MRISFICEKLVKLLLQRNDVNFTSLSIGRRSEEPNGIIHGDHVPARRSRQRGPCHLNDSEEKVTSVLQILRERLRTFTPNELKIRLDGLDLSGQYILLEVMNIRLCRAESLSCPHAHPGDGLLDIAFVSADERDKLSMCLSDSINGKLARPALTVRKGSTTAARVGWVYRAHR